MPELGYHTQDEWYFLTGYIALASLLKNTQSPHDSMELLLSYQTYRFSTCDYLDDN
jgi:hypothetical protein